MYIRDLEKALVFYHELLGLPVINYVENKHLFLRAGSSVLLCFNPDDSRTKVSPPPHYADGKQHLAFEVGTTNYSRCKEELLRKGVRITDYVTWKNGNESFYFEDPEGNVLEILPDNGIWD